MPTELLTRISLDALYPPFMEKVVQLVGLCHDLGKNYYVISGHRSPEEQLALWRKGRSANGAVVDPKQVVTYLKSGKHNYGLAVDLVRDSDLTKTGLQPSYKPEDYDLLVTTAEGLGLVSGARWKMRDLGHVELNLEAKNITLGQVRRIEQIHGMKAAWKFLDSHGPW